jgi:predicted RNase H-like HicB family nuclease
MSTQKHLTAVIYREDDRYVSLCPELDVASQGATVEEARANLVEAVELYFECASPAEIASRAFGAVYVSPIEVTIG